MNKKLSSTIQINNEQTNFTWHPKVIIDGLKPKNIYGFCITNDNKVVLVRDKDETRFTLPGGGIQEGESPVEALIREFREEAQFIPLNIELLGTLEVRITNKKGEVIEHHQQVRFICSIDNPGDFIPEKDGWETAERIFVNIEELKDYLEWLVYPSGKAQLDDLQKKLDKKSTTP